MNRRQLLQSATAIVAAKAIRGLEGAQAEPQSEAGATLRFFPGFTASRVQTSGAAINVVKGGQGPPVLLLHGRVSLPYAVGGARGDGATV